MRQVTGWWLAAGLMLSCTLAHADFRLKEVPSEATSARCVVGLEEVGDRPALRSLLTHGSEKDAGSALRAIVPQREVWKLDLASGLGVVSWDGGKPWPDIAADIARRAPACVRIDWNTRMLIARRASAPGPQLVVEPAPGASPPVADSATRSGSSVLPPPATSPVSHPSPPGGTDARDVSPTSRTPGEAPTPAAARVADEPKSPPAPPAVLYALREGETLRQTLERWTKDAQWKLVWDAQMDYPISVSMTFPPSVTFRDAVGEVLRSYWHLPYALEGRMYQNNVLEIVGRTR